MDSLHKNIVEHLRISKRLLYKDLWLAFSSYRRIKTVATELRLHLFFCRRTKQKEKFVKFLNEEFKDL